jgi:hypothetical protein
LNALLSALRRHITIPVFVEVAGKDGGGGSNVRYHIARFAGFRVEAFKIYTDPFDQGVSTIWGEPSCNRPPGAGGMQTVCIDGYCTAHRIPIGSSGIVTIELIE